MSQMSRSPGVKQYCLDMSVTEMTYWSSSFYNHFISSCIMFLSTDVVMQILSLCQGTGSEMSCSLNIDQLYFSVEVSIFCMEMHTW